MNRVIKFRGKHTDEGRWYYGSLVVESEHECTMVGNDFGEVPVDPATVGQFTGLLDKSGVEIYEGDVVLERQYSGDDKWMIRYDVSLSEYRAENPEDECDDISLNLLSTAHIEVIGSIHDNHELLNPKQS